jgi:hypothetical protein
MNEHANAPNEINVIQGKYNRAWNLEVWQACKLKAQYSQKQILKENQHVNFLQPYLQFFLPDYRDC